MKPWIAVLAAGLLLCTACAANPSLSPSADAQAAASEGLSDLSGQQSDDAVQAEAVQEPVSSFTVRVKNSCSDAIHGIGFECCLNGEPYGSVLCTEQDGGWVDPDGYMEQTFDAEPFFSGEDLSGFSATVYVVSGESVQFCLEGEIRPSPENGGVYTYELTGSAAEGYRLK